MYYLYGRINGEIRVGIREASVKIAISHPIFQRAKASLIAQYFFFAFGITIHIYKYEMILELLNWTRNGDFLIQSKRCYIELTCFYKICGAF